jgi:hypothetical protein
MRRSMVLSLPPQFVFPANRSNLSVCLSQCAQHSYGECTTSRRTSCPKRFHEKIFYLSCIFL